MSLIPYQPTEIIYYYSLEEIAQLLEVAKLDNHRNYTFILFLYHTGARVGEVADRTIVKDIDFMNKSIKLLTLKRRKKVYRTISINEQLLLHLSLLITEKGLGPDSVIFKFNRKHADKIIKKYTRQLNFDKDHQHCHCLRHTHAIHSIKNGVPLSIIQKRLGHASLYTTGFYLQFDLKAENEYYKDFGNINYYKQN